MAPVALTIFCHGTEKILVDVSQYAWSVFDPAHTQVLMNHPVDVCSPTSAVLGHIVLRRDAAPAHG